MEFNMNDMGLTEKEACGKLYIVSTPIGNLGDITLRAIETLKNADIIAAEDTRRTLRLLNHLGIKKRLISYFEHNRREKGQYLIDCMNNGQNVALVSDAGTPAISDPGEDLVRLCVSNNIKVVIVPGAVAAIAGLCASGLSTGRFAFEGFLPTGKKSRKERLDEISCEKRTIIFYEAPHKLLNTLKALNEVFGSDRKLCIARELTKLHEEVMRFTVGQAVDHFSANTPKGEFVLVIEGLTENDTGENNDNVSFGSKNSTGCKDLQDIGDSENFEKKAKDLLKAIEASCLDRKEALKKAAAILGISRRLLYEIVYKKQEELKK